MIIPNLFVAQKIDFEAFENIKPRCIGPAGMSGRVTSIDVDLNNPEVIYAGTASGGLWRSEDGGISWDPLFDKEDVISIGAVAINQKNTAEIWVGTGEGNPRNSMNTGKGIYLSKNRGRSWELMGLEETKSIHRIYLHEGDDDVIYVGAMGSTWGPNKERGIYRSDDKGKSWKKVLYVNDTVGCADLIIDPNNPNKLIAAMWSFERKPWTFRLGGSGSGLYITYDRGDNWTRLDSSNGLPSGDLGRIGLSFAPSNPRIVYALIEAKENGLYKSTDGGHSWKKIATKNIGNRPFYYSDLFVDSQNENRIYNLHSTVTLSEDGGRTFRQLLPFESYSGVHPDHHAFWQHPDDPNYIIEGNDGGLYISRDRGHSWRFIENMPLAQFYHINYDMEVPYNVYGGLQDNGSWCGPAYHWQYGGIKNHHWLEINFGDGFDVVPQPHNDRFGYSMWQGGNLSIYDKKTGRNEFIKPVHPGDTELRFNWNAAIAQDPHNDCGVYYGSQFVHYSDDCGKTWTIISPDLTSNDPKKQKQNESGGLTIDDTNAENNTSLICIAPSPADKNVIWTGSDDGKVFITRDGGEDWNDLTSNISGFPDAGWVEQIEISTNEPGEAFVVVNNYRQNDWTPYCFHTKDYGRSWKNIINKDQVQGHAISIVQDDIVPKLLFLGTDFGLYISIDGGSNWGKWMNGYPSASTRDLKIHPREHDLIIGTFGRAAYVLDDIRFLRELALNPEMQKEKMKILSAREGLQVEHQSIQGTRFIADAAFVGQNRSNSVMLTCWIHEDLFGGKSGNDDMESKTTRGNEEDEEKDGEDMSDLKAKFQVFDLQGDTIRTFLSKVDTGMNRIYWDMRAKGILYASHKKPKLKNGDPRGLYVLPGEYKIVMSIQDHKDSINVHVKPDPRSEVSDRDLVVRREHMEELEHYATKAMNAYWQLKKAESTIKLANGMIKNSPDSARNEIKDLGAKMQDSIEMLVHLYLMPKDFKGLSRDRSLVNSMVNTAMNYLGTAEGIPGENAIIAKDEAIMSCKKAVSRINNFFSKDWKNYKQNVEQNRSSIFDEYELISID